MNDRMCGNASQAAIKRAILVIGIAGGLLDTSGCAPYQSAHRAMHRNLSEFPPVQDAKQSCAVYRHWAESEWAQVHHEAPRKHRNAYRRGYIDGFVDAVYAGGNGDPPVVPPRPYWRVLFRNAAGDEEIATWTQGFRHGARTALEGGYRDRALIPTSQQFLGPEPDEVWERPASLPADWSDGPSAEAGELMTEPGESTAPRESASSDDKMQDAVDAASDAAKGRSTTHGR